MTLTSKSDTVKLDNYTFYNCYRFYFDVPQWIDEEKVIWLAPEVGFVSIGCLGCFGGKDITLEEAIIQGVHIEF